MDGIRESAGDIDVASREVASGNQDFSGRTEQAASNLQHRLVLHQVFDTVLTTIANSNIICR